MIKIEKIGSGLKISNGKKSVVISKNDRWITVKRNHDDEEEKGRHLLIEDGETPEEAMERQWKIKLNKKDNKGDDDGDKKQVEEVKDTQTKTQEKAGDKEIVTIDNMNEENIKNLTEEEIKKLDEDIQSKEFEFFKKKESFVQEHQKDLIDELNNADEEMNNAGYGTPEYYKAWEKYKEIKEKVRQSERELEDEFDSNSENIQKRLELSKKRSIFWSEQNRRYKEKQDRIKKAKDEFTAKVEKLAVDEYTMSDNDFQKARKDLIAEIENSENLDNYERFKLKKAITEKTGFVSFDRSVNEIKNKVANYSKNTDRLVERLENFETFSQKYKREKEEDDKKTNELWDKYNTTESQEEKEAINGEIEKIVRREYFNSEERVKKDVEMTNQLLVETFGDTGSKIETPKLRKGSTAYRRFNEISSALNGVISKETNTKNPPKFNGRRGRANYSPYDNAIMICDFYDADTAIHEYMHYLEHQNPKMIENSRAFLEYRTKGEEAQSLNKLTGERGYSSSEIARKDKFFKAYCGKMYGGNASYRTADATELMSMGAQRLFTDPKGFAKEDREYFDFVIANLRGEL